MRILVANKFWYRRGGLERVMFDEIAWLEGAGHEVAHFAAAHPGNDASPWADYFAPYLELGLHGTLSIEEKMRAAIAMFSNREAARRFDRLIADFGPDIIHVHGIHRQLSPSILDVARRRAVPVVQTLHDCHHICPADVLRYRGGEPCQPRRCGVIWYGPCVRGRCVRGSFSASLLSASETSWQRMRRSYERGIARFISPSTFLAEQMREGAWSQPCDIIRNAVALPSADGAVGEGFCVIGRLSPEKGVVVALEAARRAGVTLTVAGEGPSGSSLRAAYPEAKFVGLLDELSAARLVGRSRAVVVPSVCLENAPMSVLEAMSAEKPVIASSIGGIPEQVLDGVDGLLVPPGDIDGFAAAMRRCAEDDSLCARLGHAARETVRQRFSPETHLEDLLVTYRAAGTQ